VAEQLRQQWREGHAPDVRAFLADQAEVSLAELTEVLRVDQRERWLLGERIPAEQYLGDFFALEDSSDHALDLVYAEYLLREELGDAPSLEEYVERFPRLADTLRLQVEFHRALGTSDAAAPSEGSPSRVLAGRKTVPGAGWETKPASGWPVVDGYELVGVLGRGGMGVVYKAWQRRLKRLVALKMVRGGPERDAEHRGRFRAEYEILARLRHPNIVQIYEAGEVAAGDSGAPMPFFSLEYVEGGSLDRVLAGRPQPARETAELVRTLALAVQHAHEAGVVHRDLKPANVLLQRSEVRSQRSEVGKQDPETISSDLCPKITDFGLAKLVDPGPAAGKHTLSGQVIGTPCYLSPEQAAASPGSVGPAADVWALGVILYECLTGRPPFQGATMLETLEQVRSRDAVPPVRLRAGVPRDLEIICLKCLEKEPERRYASARELAEDLGRFLDGRPICARPASAWERGLKWARRRPAVTLLLFALAVSLLGLVGLGVWSYVQIREALALAKHESIVAEEQKEEALRNGEEARRHAAEARRHAELAGRAVYRFWTEFDQVILQNRPQLAALRRQFLKNAVEFYTDLLRIGSDDPEMQAAQGRAYMNYAQITAKVATLEEALVLARKGQTIFRRLVRRHPDNGSYRTYLAQAHVDIGNQLTRTNRFDAAEEEYRAALRHFEPLPRDPQRNAEREDNRASVYHNLGLLQLAAGRPEQAERSYRTALAMRGRLVRAHTDVLSFRSSLAMTQTELANLFTATGRPREAEAPCRAALDSYRLLAWLDRFILIGEDRPRARVDLGRGCLSLGTLLLQMDRPAQAVEAFDEGVRLFGKLAADFPDRTDHRHALAVGRTMRGKALVATGKSRRAEEDFDGAAKLFAGLVQADRRVSEYTLGLAATEGNLALLRRDRGQLKEAHAGLTRALDTLKALLTVQPRHGPARQMLRHGLLDRSHLAARLGQHADALRDLDAALEGMVGPERSELLVLRAVTLARGGDHARALAEAETQTGLRLPPATRYNLACAWSLGGTAVLGDTHLPLVERLTRTGSCVATGFALLRQAATGGFFRSPANRQLLRTDPDLALLRTQPAFKELVRTVEKE
jgi:serine/threonine protein kinase/tetratricopeptide (TPR) repeat protein